MISVVKRWSGALLAPLLLAGCAQTSLEPRRTYHAFGAEPGWVLSIGPARTEFVGGHEAVRILAATPLVQPTANGRYYAAHRLAVTIADHPCHDRMSGDAFVETVIVVADQRTYHGCGGARLPLLDR